jgi:DivIVA domain-containing protein
VSQQGKRFRRRALRRGYKVDEVDDFLDRAEATLAGAPTGSPVASRDVHDVVFRVRFGGYDEWQVDMHLDRVERQLSAMEDAGGIPLDQHSLPPGRDPRSLPPAGEPMHMPPPQRMDESSLGPLGEEPPIRIGRAARPMAGADGPSSGSASVPGPGGPGGPVGTTFGSAAAGRAAPPPPEPPRGPHRGDPREPAVSDAFTQKLPPVSGFEPGPAGGRYERDSQRYEPPPSRYEPEPPQRGGYEPEPPNRYEEQTGRFDPPTRGFDRPRPGYDQQPGGYDQGGYDPEPPRSGPPRPEPSRYESEPTGRFDAPPGPRFDPGPPAGGMRYESGFEPGRHGKQDMTTEIPAPDSPFGPDDLHRLDVLRRTFQVRRFGSGYDPAQVNRLFDAVAATMSGRSAVPVTDGELDPAQFSLVQGGYFEAEVDGALREVRELFSSRGITR